MYTLSMVKDNNSKNLKERGGNGVEKLNKFDWIRSSGDFL